MMVVTIWGPTVCVILLAIFALRQNVRESPHWRAYAFLTALATTLLEVGPFAADGALRSLLSESLLMVLVATGLLVPLVYAALIRRLYRASANPLVRLLGVGLMVVTGPFVSLLPINVFL